MKKKSWWWSWRCDEGYLDGEPGWLVLFRLFSFSSSVLSWAIWAFIIFVSSSSSPAVGSEVTLRSSEDKDFFRSCLWRCRMTLCCSSICDLSCWMCMLGSAWGSEGRGELRPGELGYEGLDAVVSGENRSWVPVRTGDSPGTNRKTPSTSDSDIKHTHKDMNRKTCVNNSNLNYDGRRLQFSKKDATLVILLKQG